MPYFDMHCHLGFAPNAAEVARELEALGVGAFSVGVLPPSQGREMPSPQGGEVSYLQGGAEAPLFAQVKWGVGLHPWWVADGRAGQPELDALLAAISQHIYIGEVGLDFGKSHGTAREEQLVAFEAIAQACAETGGRVLSLHTVASANDVLDILERTGALDNGTCIFHWFSDSGEALNRSIKAGCYFSVGAPMLQSARGRDYARQIPLERLLLETDMPAEGHTYDVAAMQEELAQTCAHIAQLRGMDAGMLAETIAATSARLLSFV